MDFQYERFLRNTFHRKTIGDFFAKFHFSLFVARLAGKLVERIKNRKAKEFIRTKKTPI
jgi:hypothetical protein